MSVRAVFTWKRSGAPLAGTVCPGMVTPGQARTLTSTARVNIVVVILFNFSEQKKTRNSSSEFFSFFFLCFCAFMLHDSACLCFYTAAASFHDYKGKCLNFQDLGEK